MTIHQRIKHIRDRSGLTQEEFASSLGLKRGNYSQIELGKQLPTLETLIAIARKFNIGYDWLLEEKGDPEVSESVGNLMGNPNGNPKGGRKGDFKGEPKGDLSARKLESPVGKILNPTVVDTSGHRLVPITDISAAAGQGYLNTEILDSTDVFQLPTGLVKGKNPLCIRIKGTSMAPTFQDGGYLIITLLDRAEWLNMPNERCYVVVDTDGKTYFKRVKNRFSGEKGGFIVLTSDSPDRLAFPSFNLHPDEILYIWYVEMYLTHKMPNVHETYYNRLQNLEDEFQEMRDQFRTIKKQLK